jgi:hypothetical protein
LPRQFPPRATHLDQPAVVLAQLFRDLLAGSALELGVAGGLAGARLVGKLLGGLSNRHAAISTSSS